MELDSITYGSSGYLPAGIFKLLRGEHMRPLRSVEELAEELAERSICPQISEVVPAPKCFLFFALFNTVSRIRPLRRSYQCSRSWNRLARRRASRVVHFRYDIKADDPQIGPFITSAIIKRAGGRTNFAYIFLLPLGLLGVLVLYFVNNDKAKVDSARFLEHEAAEIYSQEQRDAHRVNEKAEGLEDEGVA